MRTVNIKFVPVHREDAVYDHGYYVGNVTSHEGGIWRAWPQPKSERLPLDYASRWTAADALIEYAAAHHPWLTSAHARETAP